MADCVYWKQCTAHSPLCVHRSVKLSAFLPPRSNLVLEPSSSAAAPHYTPMLREEALISITVMCLFPIHIVPLKSSKKKISLNYKNMFL